MKLKKLLRFVDNFDASEKVLSEEITDIVIDPKKAKQGVLFVSLKKGKEGKQNIMLALENGASAILSGENFDSDKVIVVDDERKGYALCAKGLYSGVCDKLKLIAVTGTNGKTTTTKIISSILQQAGKKVGTIGTLGVNCGDKVIDTGFTTPDPEILHKCFFDMAKKGVEYVVMEASAHAIELKKLEGLSFEVGVFTNLSQDHLDFFGDMENYFEAKKKLFVPEKTKLAIICGCDKWGKKLGEEILVPSLFYGEGITSDCFAENVVPSAKGTCFDCSLLGSQFGANSNFVGDYNIQNLLGGILTARMLGVSTDCIERAIPKIEPAEGRFNAINFGDKKVIVDFAHTPDGLEKVLRTAKGMEHERLVCVFGCGGNRDRGKRPIMGKIAEELCEEVVLTSDNPRFEKPLDIIEEITRGMTKGNHTIFPVREEAISYAIRTASKGDLIVVAGKGGEKYQDIDGIKYPYDDFEVIRKAIESANKAEAGKKYGN